MRYAISDTAETKQAEPQEWWETLGIALATAAATDAYGVIRDVGKNAIYKSAGMATDQQQQIGYEVAQESKQKSKNVGIAIGVGGGIAALLLAVMVIKIKTSH